MQALRKIIHIDMDAFYASVEQRDNPGLRGKPVAVGGSAERGVVMTASYEARKFGVRSAMPSSRAKRLCPDLIFVRPRMSAYKDVSKVVREIFYRYTDLVEPLSIDEAFLDVTDNKLDIPYAVRTAKHIKAAILEATGLTASAGVSYNKFLAKLASGMNKPDGLSFIPPEKAVPILMQLEVGDFHGIGKATAKKLNDMGVFTGADLMGWPEETLEKKFGKMGRWFYKIVRGEDNRKVNPHREMKSASTEGTFSEDVNDLKVLDAKIEALAEELLRRLSKHSMFGKTVTLKVKYANFESVTRSKTLESKVQDAGLLSATAKQLLRATEAGVRKVRLLGVGLSNFKEKDRSGRPSPPGQLRLDF